MVQELLDPVESLILLPLRHEILYLNDLLDSLPPAKSFSAPRAIQEPQGEVEVPVIGIEVPQNHTGTGVIRMKTLRQSVSLNSLLVSKENPFASRDEDHDRTFKH